MKYIVIGLGRFGSKLATTLTEMGHEVIGVDNHIERCEDIKDSITTAMKMDCTNLNAVRSLPLDDIDAVVVAIGEDVGASVLTCSLLKNLNVKRIIGRAVSHLHRNILIQIGIEEVVLPLEDSALQVSSILQLKSVLRLNEISANYAVAEVEVPQKYTGHLLDTVNIGERFRLKVVAIKRAPEKDILNSVFKRDYKIDLFFSNDHELIASDILVLAGRISDLKRFTED